MQGVARCPVIPVYRFRFSAAAAASARPEANGSAASGIAGATGMGRSLPALTLLRVTRGRRALAGVDVDVIHVPAEHAATAVHAHVVAQPDRVARRNAGGRQVDLRLAPAAADAAAVTAAERALAGQRVGVAAACGYQGPVGDVERVGGLRNQGEGPAVDADLEVAAVVAGLGGYPVVEAVRAVVILPGIVITGLVICITPELSPAPPEQLPVVGSAPNEAWPPLPGEGVGGVAAVPVDRRDVREAVGECPTRRGRW